MTYLALSTGLTLGRVALLWVNKKVGERLVIFIYIALSLGYALQPQFRIVRSIDFDRASPTVQAPARRLARTFTDRGCCCRRPRRIFFRPHLPNTNERDRTPHPTLAINGFHRLDRRVWFCWFCLIPIFDGSTGVTIWDTEFATIVRFPSLWERWSTEHLVFHSLVVLLAIMFVIWALVPRFKRPQ